MKVLVSRNTRAIFLHEMTAVIGLALFVGKFGEVEGFDGFFEFFGVGWGEGFWSGVDVPNYFGAVNEPDGGTGQKRVYQVGRFGAEFGGGDILHGYLSVHLRVLFVKGV